MDIDDLDPRTKKPVLRDLEVMSIEALEDYIEELKNEADRARQAIDSKQQARAGAESFFKK